jgi:hypothetical protein
MSDIDADQIVSNFVKKLRYFRISRKPNGSTSKPPSVSPSDRRIRLADRLAAD